MNFNQTHVPRSAMARLSLGGLIPAHYDKIIYLDGDIQIVGDIRPLLTCHIPEGKLLAGCDHAEVNWPELGGYARTMRGYITGLGLSRARDYFNSGVLAATRKTWGAITAEALAFFNAQSHRCQFHDQSALNAVAIGRRPPLHPRYNFVSWFRRIGAQDWVQPAIIHFTGGQKPWANHNPAEAGRFRATYDAMAARSPYLAAAFTRTSGLTSGATPSRQLGWLVPWRRILRRRRFARFLRETSFAFA